MVKKAQIDKILDVRGLLCPMPTVVTKKTLKEMKKGSLLKVVSNDITTKDSIPPLCKQEGYDLLEFQDENGLLSYLIQT